MKFWILGFCLCLWMGCSKSSRDLIVTSQNVPDTLPPILVNYRGAADTLRFASLNMGIGFPVSQLPFMDLRKDSIAFPELHRLDSLFDRGKPKDRVLFMAQVSAAESLDVIGLQEVMRYSRNGLLVSDFLKEFVTELNARSGKNFQVFFQRLNDTIMDAIWNGDTLILHFSEGNALLVREGISILDTQRVLFSNLLFVPTNGGKATERGYIYAHLQSPKGARIQLYNTHLEVLNPFRLNQARELKLQVSRARKDSVARIVVGDLNHERDSSAYNVIVKDLRFLDGFGDLVDNQHGTCCIDSTKIWDPNTNFSKKRYDFVLAKSILQIPTWRKVLLDTTFFNSVNRKQWASDHRMPAASFVVPSYKP